jgi:hypothetical protein
MSHEVTGTSSQMNVQHRVILPFIIYFLIASVACSPWFGYENSLVARGKLHTSSFVVAKQSNEVIQADVAQIFTRVGEWRSGAVTRLLARADGSEADRLAVIAALVKAVERLDLDCQGALDLSTYDLWEVVTNLFAQLKAVEAADTLVRYVCCGDGLVGIRTYDFPAQAALVTLGEAVVPKLGAALVGNYGIREKQMVADCLGDIGGGAAKRALEEALPSVTNVEVKRSIRFALDTIARTAIERTPVQPN